MHLSHSITKTQFIYLFVFHLVSLLFYSHAIYASTSSAIPFPPGSRLSAHRTPLSFESIFYWLIKAILPRPHCNRALLMLRNANGFLSKCDEGILFLFINGEDAALSLHVCEKLQSTIFLCTLDMHPAIDDMA